MPIVSLSEWNQYLQSHPNVHLLQTGEWGELKYGFGWDPIRMISGGVGAQVSFVSCRLDSLLDMCQSHCLISNC